jgi:lipid II isoglutaminyl synthase (glutamine-hydrolysing)
MTRSFFGKRRSQSTGVTTIRVGHLYPDYLNIYADRGNIAVLARRAAWRGYELEVTAIGLNDSIRPHEHDLFYVGGGQDREQLLVAENLAGKAEALREGVENGAAVLAVCGGYQLLGRGYRGFHGEDMPGIGLLPLDTVAGDKRMIGDVLIECELEAGQRHTLAGFENHAGRTRLDAGAEPLGRVLSGFGNDGESGFEGCRVGRVLGTYLHGPLLPRNPWLADWLLAQALAHRSGGEPPELEPLSDELERRAHEVSAGRARSRGGRYA